MNMIVNKSDLVGYEAVETKAAKKEALAKLVAAWESKQARNARRFGGLGFLAVSLAACNSSDDDTTTTTTTTTTTETTTVASGLTPTLTDDDSAGVSVDVITGSTSADTITGTQATLDTSDVITDATSGDGDTLNVNATAAVSSPSIVNGIENVNYNMTTFGTGVQIDVDNVYGANITVHNKQLGGTDNVNVSGLGNGSTLNLGDQTGGVGHTVAGGNGSATINAGTGAMTVTAISTDGMTINTVTGSSLVLNGAAATSIATVNAATGVTTTIDAGTGGTAISNLTLSGGGSFTITGTAAGAYTASGASGATVIGAPGMFDGLALTDSTTGGTVTLQLNDLVGGAHNMDEMLADVIEITDDASGSAAPNTLTVASGTTVTISHDLAQALTIDADAARTGAPDNDSEVGSVNVAQDLSAALTVSDFETITVTTTGTDAITLPSVVAAATATLTLNGTAPLDLTAVTADSVDASGYTGAITHTMADGTADNFTFGSGDDVVTFATGDTITIVGGAGNDTLKGTTDMSNVTFSGFEILDLDGAVTASKSSQFTGGDMIVNGGVNVAISTVDTATVDLSGYTIADATLDGFNVAGNNVDNAKLATTVPLNITGSAGKDSLTGSDNADTISGGAGADTITGGIGIDTLTGGAGVDTFEFVAADFTAASNTALAAAADKITDFAASSATTAGAAVGDGDAIGWGANGTVLTVAADATAGAAQVATAGAAAVFHADDDTLAERITAVESITAGTTSGQAVLFGHGSNSYVFISGGTDNVAAGDALIELTGFDSTGKTLEANSNNDLIIF